MFTCIRMAVAVLGILSAQANAATFINFNGSTGVFGNDMVDSGSFIDVIDLGNLAPGEYLIPQRSVRRFRTANRPIRISISLRSSSTGSISPSVAADRIRAILAR